MRLVTKRRKSADGAKKAAFYPNKRLGWRAQQDTILPACRGGALQPFEKADSSTRQAMVRAKSGAFPQARLLAITCTVTFCLAA